jgi:hypothetical protein
MKIVLITAVRRSTAASASRITMKLLCKMPKIIQTGFALIAWATAFALGV